MKRNFSILTALVFTLALGLSGLAYFTPTQAPPVQAGAAAPVSAAEAQQELARFSSANIARIKDEKVRAAAQRALSAL